MLICLIYNTLESMQQWDQVVGEIMLLSGVRRRKTHYCAEAHWPRGAQRETRVHSLGRGRNNICIFQETLGGRFGSALDQSLSIWNCVCEKKNKPFPLLPLKGRFPLSPAPPNSCLGLSRVKAQSLPFAAGSSEYLSSSLRGSVQNGVFTTKKRFW